MSWDTILSSTVVATIFSGLLSYIISRRQGNLQYVTGEREQWREKIRIIAIKLDGASYKDTLKLLTELKLRINSYGNNGVSNEYKKDAHIWNVINELEKQKLSKKVLILKQKQLIEYLALLLKADWERTKNEVRGNLYDIASWIMFILSNLYFTISIFLCNEYMQINQYTLITMAGIYVFIIFIFNILIDFEVKKISEIILRGIISEKAKKYSQKRLIICYLLCTICVVGHVFMYWYIVRQAFGIIENARHNQLSITLLVILYMFGLGFKYVSQKVYIDNEFYYVNSINRIRVGEQSEETAKTVFVQFEGSCKVLEK